MQAWIDEARMQAEAADGWSDEETVDALDVEADILAEIYAELDAARDASRRLQEHEAARIEAMLATDAAQAAMWPPY